MEQAPLRVDGRALRYQNRRPELLAAAAEHVLDHGIGELSLRPMAQALGVTHSTLIRQFASKDGLLAEVVEYVRDRALTQLSKLDGAQSTADLARAFWRLLDDPRERRQFLMLTEIYTLAQRDWGQYSSVLKSSADDFRRPIETLLVRDGLSPHRATVIATALLAQIRGLQLDLIATGDHDRVNDAFSATVDALLPSNE